MNVRDYLKQKQVPFDVISHHDTYDAQHLAQSMHVSGRLVAKTVLLRTEGEEDFVVAVLPANRIVDLDLVSDVLGVDYVELASERQLAQHCPDCEVGVLPPFGHEYGMRTVVDLTLLYDEVIVF